MCFVCDRPYHPHTFETQLSKFRLKVVFLFEWEWGMGKKKSKQHFVLLHKRASSCQRRLEETGFYAVKEQLQVQLDRLVKWLLIADWHPCG